MSDFPKMVYHSDGSNAVVTSDNHHKSLGSGWNATPGEKHHAAARKTSGAVIEVMVPVRVMNATDVGDTK